MNDDMICAADLWDELERLIERFWDEPVAVEALEAVKFWLQGGTVDDLEDDGLEPVTAETRYGGELDDYE